MVAIDSRKDKMDTTIKKNDFKTKMCGLIIALSMAFPIALNIFMTRNPH
ncbi:hypothetical protein BROSI_A1518 [Candidatus Brocadia sinica JPN1]|uniref:Uncharacterized protein n=1 Tax=Candidatus Brocadia sinica JPN1 TaxID=1197129 RepID=A0ABQ0JWI9_9BACT|nr:hypothetical protein BROSI_A1518 [Candidatus Brocadia sinica JPN1]